MKDSRGPGVNNFSGDGIGENSLFPKQRLSSPGYPSRHPSFKKADIPFADQDDSAESETALPFEPIIVPAGAKEYAEAFLRAEGYRVLGEKEPKQLSLFKPHKNKT